MIKKLLALCIILSLILVGCTTTSVEEHNTLIMATVEKKEYVAPRTRRTFMYTGKVMVPITHHDPPKYKIYFKYKTLQIEKDDETLFEVLEEEDEYPLILTTRYNADTGEIIKQYISVK